MTLNYELLLLRTDILGLIKRVAKEIRFDFEVVKDWQQQGFVLDLHAPHGKLPILKQLTYIYRHNGGKV